MKLDFGQCKQSPPDHQNTKLIFVTFYFQYNNRTLVRCIRNFLVVSNRMFFPAPAFLNRLPCTAVWLVSCCCRWTAQIKRNNIQDYSSFLT